MTACIFDVKEVVWEYVRAIYNLWWATLGKGCIISLKYYEFYLIDIDAWLVDDKEMSLTCSK